MSAHLPFVSVILPTFDRAWTLAKAIHSVLDQTYRAFELIVVDDGSSDGTSLLLARFSPRIQVIAQENKGVSAARNAGIHAAKGQLIAFLDSDDAWLPEKLNLQVRYFLQHPDCLICQTEEQWIRNGLRVNPAKRHRKAAGMIFERSLALCLVSPSAVMLKKSLLDAVGLFDEDLPACEDYDLWLRITHRHPVHLIDTPLVVKYGGHADQLSRKPQLDRFRIRSIARLLDGKSLSPPQHKAAVAMLKTKCRIYANGCRKRGRKKEALMYEKWAQAYG